MIPKNLVYEGVILENPFLKKEWRERSLPAASPPSTTLWDSVYPIPQGVTPGVPAEIYSEYRKGRDSACVDIVLVTRLEDGTPAVLLSLRKPDVCYGNKWWIYGGALQAYRGIEDFISERATKECGVPVKPEVLIGVYRTMSEDFIGSTLQPCYAACVSIEAVRAKMSTDPNHSSVRVFTLEEIEEIPYENTHWYPMRVSRLAIAAMPK
jgi:hypothetical protein